MVCWFSLVLEGELRKNTENCSRVAVEPGSAETMNLKWKNGNASDIKRTNVKCPTVQCNNLTSLCQPGPNTN